MKVRTSLLIGALVVPQILHAGVTGNGALTSLGNGASNSLGNGASSGLGNGASSGLGNGATVTLGNGATTTYTNGASASFPNGATINFPNGAAVSLGNGASAGFPNGATPFFPNGATITFPNGAAVAFPNGASVSYNGATTTYTNGASATFPNGASITFTNGASMSFPNGATVGFPNGATITMPNGATITLPNGAVVSFPNGATATFPNGASTGYNGYSTQAFLTSNLFRYPTLQSQPLQPSTWQTTHAQLYAYLVAALQAANGHPVTAINDGISFYADPYDLLAFKYLLQSSALSSSTYTVSYSYQGTTWYRNFTGGLGLCASLATGGANGPGPTDLFNGNPEHDFKCSQWVTAAVAVWTQPVGINNMISITNLAAGDPSTLAPFETNASPALALANVIQPLPRRRGVPAPAPGAPDGRAVLAMNPSDNLPYAGSTNPTQGGWVGLWAIRCVGGSTVTFNLHKLKTLTTLPGTATDPKTLDLVLRANKGVHGANYLDSDWVLDHDDYTATDKYPNASFSCGQGYSEVSVANRPKYYFVYNFLVRDKNGNQATADAVAAYCLTSPTACLGSPLLPPSASPNATWATEAEIFTLKESYNFGNAFFGLTRTMDPVTGSASSLLRDQASNLLLAESCDVRSVNASSAATESWNPQLNGGEFGANFASALWHFPVGNYTAYTHQAVPSDRSLYARNYCSSFRSDKCIACTEGNSFMPDLRVSSAGQSKPFQASAPAMYTTRITGWRDPPKFANEASIVEQNYYAATRVCAQQNDNTAQGYCFAEWGCLASDPTCPASRQVAGAVEPATFAMNAPGQLGTNAYGRILKVSLPQSIQPILATDAGLCPVGYTKNASNGRCFQLLTNGQSCQDDMQCASNICETTAGVCVSQLTVTASQSTTSGTYVATKATDGNTNAILAMGSVSLTGTGTQQWWKADLGATKRVRAITFVNRSDANPNNDCLAQTSTDNVNWTTVANYAGTMRPTTKLTLDTSVRYVRLIRNASGSVNLAEVTIHGY